MKVLCIDGGGIRGLIPALVLAEIERRTGRRIAELVDLVAGTSTGGILACGLTRPGPDGRPLYSADELAGIYVEEGPQIFDRSLLKRISSVDGWVDERYDDDGLNAALARYLGDATLSQALADVLVTAYEISDRFAFFFRSARARGDPAYDFPLVQVARATGAAPSYFEPAEVTDVAGARTYPLIDGGVFAVNPSMCALADVTAAGRGDELRLMLSLGTGEHTRSYSFEQTRSWGQLEWARPVLDMVFDGVADTTDFEAATLMGDRYVRLQTQLNIASDDLDDASERNLAALRREAEQLIARSQEELDRVCAVLAG
ncbi:MAG TPA: patatin-like phospholipase family protein [Solirubrobacteraceae bacterium]|nr:patatin-like phospholipase family protein [Solirubrobacteraceae bacterium]